MRKLSSRLNAVLSLIVGNTLVDIGTDHAYLPIEACLKGRVETAIACDLNPGPLKTATENVKRYGLTHRVELRLGYGLSPICCGEADCITIAGMGGMRIIDILHESPSVVHSVKRMVLQPQHDIPAVRMYLYSIGFRIVDEISLREKGHLYTVMAAEA